MKVEKAIELVKKLLTTANDKGASENEAMMAALKAQEIMAKYNIEITDVDGESDSEEIVDSAIDVGNGNKWKYNLANIVANNFCCKIYGCGAQTIFFYGYKKHAEVAKEVFVYLYATGNKLADRCYAEFYNKKQPTKGVKNDFLIGYCNGIKSVLEKQCTALALVIPKDVSDSFDEKMKGAKTHRSNIKVNMNHEAYEKGVREGKNIATARSIEG